MLTRWSPACCRLADRVSRCAHGQPVVVRGGYWHGLRPNKQKKSVDPKGFLDARDSVETTVDVTGNRG
jgi:hypothetical protein